MNEEIIIHKDQTTIDMFNYTFKMSISEFNDRCMPKSNGQSAEFDLRAVDLAFKDGIKYSIETLNNQVYFREIK